MTPSLLEVFVYGTLKPGERNYPLFCGGKVSQTRPALVRGVLYEIPSEMSQSSYSYPAMAMGSDWVAGYLLTFTDEEILIALDQLEGFQPGRSPTENEYQREWLDLYTPKREPFTQAWGYMMLPEKIQQLGGRKLDFTDVAHWSGL
ncbi:MAG: gamma-glutamylcyclotransferase [Limnothrix sp. RL_2_0]|nr:gamma-glutamylcyclotransferase [Limnothrix sp. RL_2_0]